MIRISASSPPPMYMRVSFLRFVDPRSGYAVETRWPKRARRRRARVRLIRDRSEKGDDMPPRGVKKGDEASEAVRAHQGLAARAGQVGGRGRGDRRPNGEQGTCPERRGRDVVEALEEDISSGRRGRAPQRPEGASRPRPATSSTKRPRARNIRGRSKMTKAQLDPRARGSARETLLSAVRLGYRTLCRPTLQIRSPDTVRLCSRGRCRIS